MFSRPFKEYIKHLSDNNIIIIYRFVSQTYSFNYIHFKNVSKNLVVLNNLGFEFLNTIKYCFNI